MTNDDRTGVRLLIRLKPAQDRVTGEFPEPSGNPSLGNLGRHRPEMNSSPAVSIALTTLMTYTAIPMTFVTVVCVTLVVDSR